MTLKNPVHSLTHEHKHILKVVYALGVIGEDIETGREIQTGIFPDIVRFMREFADKCHHAKEEAVLFPAMEKKGVPETGCPLGALRAEHVKARGLVAVLEKSADAFSQNIPEARRNLTQVIREITRLYPNHIWKEDAMVFPMTEKMFTEEELIKLTADFASAESEYGKNHDLYVTFANHMETRFGQGPVKETPSSPACE